MSFGGETGGGTEAAWCTTPAQKRSRMRQWLMMCLPHRFAGLRDSVVQAVVCTLAERTLLDEWPACPGHDLTMYPGNLCNG